MTAGIPRPSRVQSTHAEPGRDLRPPRTAAPAHQLLRGHRPARVRRVGRDLHAGRLHRLSRHRRHRRASTRRSRPWLAEVLPTYFSRNAHMLGLPAIKLAGDTATARTFCFNPMVLKGDKPRDHAGRRLVRRRVRPHRRRLADIPSRRGQVLRQGAVTVFTHPTCVVCCGDFSKSAATSATVDGPVDRAIFAGSGRSGTIGGCLPRDYGCAAVTHVRQNRIRATARDR